MLIFQYTCSRSDLRRPAGAAAGPAGAVVGLLRDLLGLLWGPLGLPRGPWGCCGATVRPLWASLVLLWGCCRAASVGLLWGELGLLLGLQGLLWGPLGRRADRRVSKMQVPRKWCVSATSSQCSSNWVNNAI